MGGGGFMKHASDTNRKDKAQKAARREKFSGNHSDKTLLNIKHSTKLDFSHLSQEQIDEERLRINTYYKKKKKKNIRTALITLLVIVLIIALTDHIGFAFIFWLTIYSFLGCLAYIIYQFIKRMKWSKWLRGFAFLPFLLFWIYIYQPADAVYYYAYEDVTKTPLPEDFSLIEKWQSSVDFFGDYSVFAVFQIRKKNAIELSKKFSQIESCDSTRNTPRAIEEYLAQNLSLDITGYYHTFERRGWEVYGAVLSDNRSVIIYTASW